MMFYREARFLKRSTCACGNPCQSKKFTEVKTLGGGGGGFSTDLNKVLHGRGGSALR